MKKFICILLSTLLPFQALAQNMEQQEVQFGDTTVLINDEEMEKTKELKEQLAEILAELKATEGKLQNGLLVYDITHVLQEVAGLTAAATLAYGKYVAAEPYLQFRGAPGSETLMSKFSPFYVARKITAAARRVGLERLATYAEGKLPVPPFARTTFPMPAKFAKIGLGSLAAVFVLAGIKTYEARGIYWTAEQRETLIRQLKHVQQQIKDVENGIQLLQEDPTDLILQEDL
jgi:hypothetical protein